MRTILLSIVLICGIIGCQKNEKTTTSNVKNEDNRIVKVKLGIDSSKISDDWKDVLVGRKIASELDSLCKVVNPISKEEQDWLELIDSKSKVWNTFRDSIKVPFQNIKLKDTIYVLLGYRSGDDAFTYKDQTVCLDLTALHRAYGSAKNLENDNRIDRLFAHEFTHLLSKKWAKNNELKLNTFKDDILWECLYEGLGMYRSMSSKWYPIGDSLSHTSKNTFEVLYPKFTEKIIKVSTQPNLTIEEEKELHANLSRGSMKKKWGALPVAVWLALEAKGNDENLVKWVNKGPDAIIPLAEKYLTGESKITFEEFLKKNKRFK